jgi:hypothetical protein
MTTAETFKKLAPYLASVDSPEQRRRLSRKSDEKVAWMFGRGGAAALPQIHCFYEVLGKSTRHGALVAAVSSMRAAGHPVRLWTYSPKKLEFLKPHNIEILPADDVIPRSLAKRIIEGSEIRYFSDIFRYAVLYEHGGLWMDTDVVLLRPFPFIGDYFFNLQWRGGEGPLICGNGNVIYAKPRSRHLRNLYGIAIERFFDSPVKKFGDIGPLLLSEYIASDTGAELQHRVFSPMFFNSIDWTEIDQFNRPIAELNEYLNDDRVFGVHLWNAKTSALSGAADSSLIVMLSNPEANLPALTGLADKFNTDKNRHTGNRHFYARIYDRLLGSRRFSLRRLMEIGLCRGLVEGKSQNETPSVALWQAYFPFCRVIGVDINDFSRFNTPRFTSFVCDQSKQRDLRSVAANFEPGSIDVIIDDGSHASFDQQLTLREFFPLLAEGGWYFIEDLDWQPAAEDPGKITLTKTLLREMQRTGAARSLDPLGLNEILEQVAEILFFDSHFELARANHLGGLVAIRKRGGSRFND